MKNYFKLLDSIKDYFINDGWTNEVTEGLITDVDLDKRTLFPLVHLMVNTSTFQQRTIRYNVSIMAMDVVDMSKEETVNEFESNDNHQYIHAVTEMVLMRFYGQVLRGELFEGLFQVDGEPTLEIFTERFENYLAGWVMTLDLIVPLDLSLCEVELEELILRITQENEYRVTEAGSPRQIS